MIEASRWLVVPAVICAFAASAAAEDQPPLQPYQMVRSLQLLQDQLAGGDHAALPMQRKLLELIDGRLREAGAEAFSDRRNIRAVLVYGMSGGNPATLAEILQKDGIPEGDRKLLKGILAYLNGSTQSAQAVLGDTDVKHLPAELGAFVALVKGSVTTGSDPRGALRQFDLARLLGPGTLVEEAAIRRSLPIEASSGQAERFFRAASQYVRRFLRSPYASQFADAFVDGILALHEDLDYAAIDEITAGMDADQSKVIHLRIARRAAIAGLTDLASHASARAGEERLEEKQDPRVQLYSILSDLTSANVESVVLRLRRLDRQQLTESDIRLLEAAERLAAEMTARPTLETTSALSNKQERTGPLASADSAPPEAEAADAGAEPVPIKSEDIAPEAAASPAEPDPTAAIVSETRTKLNAIDKLLEDAR